MYAVRETRWEAPIKRIAIVVGLLVALAATAQADQSAPEAPNLPVIRISLELVQIDAVVTDAKGQHIVDLRPEEFTLDEGGKRQKITNVAYIRVGEPRLETPSEGNTPKPAVTRTIVFVVDDLGISFFSMARARSALLRLAEQPFAPGDRVALLRTGQVGGSYSLMSSRETFAAAAAALQHNLMSGSRATTLLPLTNPGRYVDELSVAAGSLPSATFRQRIAQLLGTIDGLRSLPGRKAVVLLSEGFSVVGKRYSEIGVQSAFNSIYDDSDVHSAIRMLTDMANRAGVVAYAVDPRGLESDHLSTAENINLGVPTNASLDLIQDRWSVRIDSQGTLQQLADQTGGLAFLNRNNLVGGLGAILADQRGYYLIGYEPNAATFDKSSGRPRFHSVKVKVSRPGLRVRSRAGFYGVTDDEVAQKAPAPVSN